MADAIRNLGQIRASQNPYRRGDQEMTTDLGEEDYGDEKDLHEDNRLE